MFKAQKMDESVKKGERLQSEVEEMPTPYVYLSTSLGPDNIKVVQEFKQDFPLEDDESVSQNNSVTGLVLK